MADDRLAPRARAANVSRRAFLGSAASTPLLGGLSSVPDSTAWQAAVKAYAAAHYSYEAFFATSLRPAYENFNADMAKFSLIARAEKVQVIRSKLREQISAVEDKIREEGGVRAHIVQRRITDAEYAGNRDTLAWELRARRARGKLMDRYDVFELEEKGNDLAASRSDALRNLLLTPAITKAGMLLKMRLS